MNRADEVERTGVSSWSAAGRPLMAIRISGHGSTCGGCWPDMTGTPRSFDEAFSVVTQGRRTPLDGCRTGAAVVETAERDVLSRFTNRPAVGRTTTGCWCAGGPGGHAPDPSDAGRVGVFTDHAVALVHRECTTGRVHAGDVVPHIAVALTTAQRVAAASGILTALHP